MSADIPTPAIAKDTTLDNLASRVEGVTNREHDAVMSLINPGTGTSDIRNSVGGAQRFNRIVTKAIFGNHGNDKWDHNGHFNRAKEVVFAMISAGKIAPVYDNKFAIVGIELPRSEVSPDSPDTKVDPRGLLLTNLVGKLAAAAEQLAVETAYHADADEMIGPLSDENERLKAENTALHERVTELQHSPREDELQHKLMLLEQQLTEEASARRASERKANSLEASLLTARAETKAAKAATRQASQQLRTQEDEIARLHRETKDRVEKATEEGNTKGWEEATDTLYIILSQAGYDDSARIIYSLIKSEEIQKVYDVLNELLFVIDQLDELASGNSKSISLPNRETMPTTNKVQRNWAGETLQKILDTLRHELRSRVETIVASQELVVDQESEVSSVTA